MNKNLPAMLLALEFGFKGHEKGHNIQKVKEDFLKIWGGK